MGLGPDLKPRKRDPKNVLKERIEKLKWIHQVVIWPRNMITKRNQVVIHCHPDKDQDLADFFKFVTDCVPEEVGDLIHTANCPLCGEYRVKG